MAENDRSHVAMPIGKSNRRTANCERAGNVAIIREQLAKTVSSVSKDGMLTLLGGVSVVRDQGGCNLK